jgi:hypothetical protein
MLQHPLPSGEDHELDWFMAETDALQHVRRDVSEVQRRRLITETRHWVMRRLRGSLPGVQRPTWIDGLFSRFEETRIEDWAMHAGSIRCPHSGRFVAKGAGRHSSSFVKPMSRHRDLLVALGGMDSDLLVNEEMIRFCAAFLDQGIAHRTLPDRDCGLFHTFCAIHRQGGGMAAWWLKGLRAEVERVQNDGTSALASIQESLNLLGVSSDETDDFLSATLLALRGWGGMIWHVEERADRVHHAVPRGSLIDFIAVRLLLERIALGAIARAALAYRGELATCVQILFRRFLRRDGIVRSSVPLLFSTCTTSGTPEQLFNLNREG